MATGAAIAAAAATAISAGVSTASAAGAFGGPGKPEFQQVPKRPFENAQQKYMSRVMMANLNNRGPSYQDWLKSGGQETFQLIDPGMTPKEAHAMGYTGPGGAPINTVDPATVTQTGMSPEEFAQSGRPKGTYPSARIGRLDRRISRLESRGELRPGMESRLERLKSRRENIMSKHFRGRPEE